MYVYAGVGVCARVRRVGVCACTYMSVRKINVYVWVCMYGLVCVCICVCAGVFVQV